MDVRTNAAVSFVRFVCLRDISSLHPVDCGMAVKSFVVIQVFGRIAYGASIIRGSAGNYRVRSPLSIMFLDPGGKNLIGRRMECVS